MNKILPAFLLIFCKTIFNTKAQLKDTSQPMIKHQVNADLLFQKAKRQKTTAWILLGAGTGLAIAGYAVAENAANKDGFSSEFSSLITGVIVLGAGGASMIASIPFFISSGNNRRRANVSLKNESAPISRQLHFKGNFISAGISFSL